MAGLGIPHYTCDAGKTLKKSPLLARDYIKEKSASDTREDFKFITLENKQKHRIPDLMMAQFVETQRASKLRITNPAVHELYEFEICKKKLWKTCITWRRYKKKKISHSKIIEGKLPSIN